MARPVTVSEAPDQLLETAFDLYRLIHRLHRYHEGLRVPYEIEQECCDRIEPDLEPPTIELAVDEEITSTIDELQDIADRLQKSSRLTDVVIRREWREHRKKVEG